MANNPLPPTEKPDGMPGGRAALPAGTLPGPFFGPQGDEQRQPPANAPSPIPPSPVIDDQLPPAPLPPDASR